MEGMRRCPYCDEEIRTEAIRCRHCRSRLVDFDPGRWYRDLPERRLGGVAAALAQACAIPVAAARLGFIVLTVFHFAGPALYAALWMIVPFRPGEEPPFARFLALGRRVVDEIRDVFASRRPHPPANGARPQDDIPATGIPC